MNVTFCGHSELYQKEPVRQWLLEIVEALISQGAEEFLLGGYGQFDALAASVVWEMKAKYPHIQSVLVLPYLDRKVDAGIYDYTTYPPLERVPRRYAISHRNRWLVDQSDVVVAYVLHSWGGAASTLEYAHKKNKIIRRYALEEAEAAYIGTR